MSVPMIGSGGKPLIGAGGSPMVGDAECDCCPTYPPIDSTCVNKCNAGTAPGAFQVELCEVAFYDSAGVYIDSLPPGTYLCNHSIRAEDMTPPFDTKGCYWFGPPVTLCETADINTWRPYVWINHPAGVIMTGWSGMASATEATCCPFDPSVGPFDGVLEQDPTHDGNGGGSWTWLGGDCGTIDESDINPGTSIVDFGNVDPTCDPIPTKRQSLGGPVSVTAL